MSFSVIQWGLSKQGDWKKYPDIQFQFKTWMKSETKEAKFDDYLFIKDKRHPNQDFIGYPIMHNISDLKEAVESILAFVRREKRNYTGNTWIAFGKVNFFANDVPQKEMRQAFTKNFPKTSNQDISPHIPMLDVSQEDFIDQSVPPLNNRDFWHTEFSDYYYLITACDNWVIDKGSAPMDALHDKASLLWLGVIFQLHMLNEWASYIDTSWFETLEAITNTWKPVEVTSQILEDENAHPDLKGLLWTWFLDPENMTPDPPRVITTDKIQQILWLDFAHSWSRPLKKLSRKIRNS